MNEQLKKVTLTIEVEHDRYLTVMAFVTGLSRSELIRDMIDNDMSDPENQHWYNKYRA